MKTGVITGQNTLLLTTPELRAMCDLAQEHHFHNVPSDDFWDRVDPDGTHVLVMWMKHQPDKQFWKNMAAFGVTHDYDFDYNGGLNIRALGFCKILGSEKPEKVLFDFDEKDFMKRMPEDASKELSSINNLGEVDFSSLNPSIRDGHKTR